jgi:hypothetical protein
MDEIDRERLERLTLDAGHAAAFFPMTCAIVIGASRLKH